MSVNLRVKLWWYCLLLQDRSIIEKTVSHSECCLRDIAKNEIDMRLNDCKRKVIADPTLPIPKIYEETLDGIYNDGLDLIAATPNFRNVKTALYNSRNKEAGTSKMFYTDFEQVEVPSNYQKFLFADYRYNGGRILIFGDEWSKNMLIDGKVLFIDGTFNICPKPFTQLVTIHCDIGSTIECTNIIPVLYALLPDKKTETYVTLFRLIKSQIKQSGHKKWDPDYIMADFEAAIAKAMRIVLPKTEKGGCYYHFHKAIWKKGRQLKLTKNKDTRRILALIATLPLLPLDKIQEGWSFIESQILDEFKMDAFNKYFVRTWLKNKQFQEQWCVFGKRHRTNNFAEAWHFKINNKSNRKNSLYALLKLLYNQSTVMKNRMKSIKNPPKKRAQIYVIRDRVIQNAQLHLITGDITVGHFLDMLR